MRRHPRAVATLVAWAALAAHGAAAAAQASPAQASPDTLTLDDMQAAATAADPRAAQLELLQAQWQLRERRFAAERLPALRLHAQAQRQSDVPSIPFELPGGIDPPLPPRDTYDAYLAVQQSLYDPTRAPRRDLEEARLQEERARVDVSLYDLRRQVDEAFFRVLLLDAQEAELTAGLEALQAQLEMAAEREAQGAALPSEVATLRREILRREQRRDEIRATRSTSRALLAELTGEAAAHTAPLALPDLAARVQQARQTLEEFPRRPEAERFARGQALLQGQRALIESRERPRLSAFGRGGYGRPGLNPLAREFDRYWLAGVQVEWAPWSWGATEDERQEVALQADILRRDEEAFQAEVRRGAIAELTSVDRLAAGQERDQEVVALSEEIVAEARIRYAEGAITAAELVSREAELLQARLEALAHTIELEHARARFLTLTGHTP